MRIDVEGTLGTGKTTFVREITNKYDIKPIYEPVKSNPFLDKFYDDPRRYAFTMQMWLLAKRHAANSAAFRLSKAGADVIVDRGRLGDRCFAHVNAELGNMTRDELGVYETFFGTMDARDPDMIVVLDVDEDEVLRRIAERGRECERQVDRGYLSMLRRQHQQMANDARGRGVKVIWSPTVDQLADICGLKKLD